MGHVDVATRQAAQGCGVIIIKAAVIVNTKFSAEWKSTKLNKIHGAERRSVSGLRFCTTLT